MSFDLRAVPGVAELLGKGIYTAMPDELPDAIRGQYAVVIGEAVAGAMAALRLSECACCVTLVLHESGRNVHIPRDLRRALRLRANLRTQHGTELAWAVGIDHLEALILRRIASSTAGPPEKRQQQLSSARDRCSETWTRSRDNASGSMVNQGRAVNR